jgi:AsmA protein
MDFSMRYRLKWAALLIVAVALAGAGTYRWPLSSAYVAAELGRQLTDVVGLELHRPARAYLTILPRPTLQIIDIELGGKDSAPVIAAPIAKVRLALAPLLIGRLQVSSAILRRPTVLIDLDRSPFAKDSALARAIDVKTYAETLNAASDAKETPLGALSVERGLLHIVSAKYGLDTLMEDVAGDFEWPRVLDAARLNLRATWRGAPATITARLDAPAQLLAAGGSPAMLNIASPIASIRLEGEFKSGDTSPFEGALSADVASTAALARLFGEGAARFPPDGRVALTSKIAFNPPMLTLSDMRLEALEQTLDGALALTHTADGWSISGSLAADQINLDDLFAKAPALVEETGEWSDEPLTFGLFGAVALDLRTSIAKVVWRGHELQDAALSFVSHNGGATATLSEATAYNGALKGEISFSPSGQGVEMQGSANLANADIGALVAEFGASGYSGQGGAEFAVRSSGDSPAALARALAGDVAVKLGPGVIEGVSFEEALRRSERRPINLFADMRTGRTVFNEAEARATIEKGEARVRSAAMIGPGVLVTMKGGANLAARELATQFTVVRADQHGAPDLVGPQINVTISGPWSRPTVKSDTGA